MRTTFVRWAYPLWWLSVSVVLLAAATPMQQTLLNLCPPAVCLGTGSNLPVQIFVDGKPRLELTTAGVLEARNSTTIGSSLLSGVAVAWATITGTPTTLAGYGITDAPALSEPFVTKIASSSLTNEFALGSLGNGLLLNTTTTGVPTVYAGGSCTAQFPRSIDASGALTCASVSLTADVTGTLPFANGGDRTTIVVKSNDESVTSSTVLQADNHLVFTVGASEVWIVSYMLFYDGATGGDIKFNLTVPASGSYIVGGHGINTDLSTISVSATSSSGADIIMGAVGSGTGIMGRMDARVGGGTGGTVTLTWAQNASDGTATRIFAQSYLVAQRVN